MFRRSGLTYPTALSLGGGGLTLYGIVSSSEYSMGSILLGTILFLFGLFWGYRRYRKYITPDQTVIEETRGEGLELDTDF